MSALIFDCDGVLVDSEKLSCGTWLPVLERRGIHAALADIEAFIGKSDQAVLDHYRDGLDPQLDGEIIAEWETEYFSLARDRLRSFPGLRQVLEELTERHIPMAVASSGRPDKIRFSLELVGLRQYFPIRCSTVEVARGKPAPDLFLRAAHRLARDPGECAVVEDSVPGIEAGRRAGMRVLGFTSTYAARVLLAAGAHATFASYADFIPLLSSVQAVETKVLVVSTDL